MNRDTIDFGIDLGTTNSAIAVLKGVVPEIIKNNVDRDITPSAVYINKRGAVQVGQGAKDRLKDQGATEDAYLEFKRRMGTAHTYPFRSSGRSMKPEDLSAEVLKQLRAEVQSRTGEEVTAAVITVPAAFELHQCEATKKAATLAGFTQSALLQEPVAAALAYGFQIENSRGYWLVYDFGGGTFDAALIRAEDGTISVANHGGDNFLGGSDIDSRIVDELLLPEVIKVHDLPEISRKDKTWTSFFYQLKFAAEEAKIQLSQSDTAFVERRLFLPSGVQVDFECQMLRSDVVRLTEPLVTRSVEICRRVVKEKGLTKSDIERVILVGGPTLAPYFRAMLQEGLDMSLDNSVDPLTVVARGAAVFAGTQRIQTEKQIREKRGKYTVDLKYKPVGAEVDPRIGGRVVAADGTSLDGFTVDLVNQRTKWRSGRIPLRADGAFMADLLAEKGIKNTFQIELLNSSGTHCEVVPNEFSYTVGVVVEEQPLINSLHVALANNGRAQLIAKGVGLPAKGKTIVRSALEIKRGQSGEVCRIPIVEGENELGDRNRLIGFLNISGENLRRDLPVGSEIEVTCLVDASRLITAKAYVPILDEEITVKIDLKHVTPQIDTLRTELATELKRLRDLKDEAEAANDAKSTALIAEVEESDLLRTLKSEIENASADPDAALRSDKHILELRLRLDVVADKVKLPSLIAEAKELATKLQDLVTEYGTTEVRAKAKVACSELDEAISQKNADRVCRKKTEVEKLYWSVLVAQPAFWVGYFNDVAGRKAKMRDQARAERLIQQGRECIEANNVDGLRQAVHQLSDLLPKELAQALQKGYQSGVIG
jgi:molecular chaperone DnaK